MDLNDPFRYLLPLTCCDEVIRHKKPTTCPFSPVYNAPVILSSDIATIVANPKEESVTVTCNSQNSQIPVASSFSAVTNCALQVGLISKPGVGSYVTSNLKFVADKTFMEILAQLVSMELFYILGGSTVFVVVLSLVMRPLANGIITVRDCLHSRFSGEPSVPPIMTGFAWARSKADPSSPV